MKAPEFCKDAIPTNMGWKDPRTGRIVAPYRNLLQMMVEAEREKKRTYIAETKVPLPENADENMIDVSDELQVEPATQPKKKRKKKQANVGINNGETP